MLNAHVLLLNSDLVTDKVTVMMLSTDCIQSIACSSYVELFTLLFLLGLPCKRDLESEREYIPLHKLSKHHMVVLIAH